VYCNEYGVKWGLKRYGKGWARRTPKKIITRVDKWVKRQDPGGMSESQAVLVFKNGE